MIFVAMGQDDRRDLVAELFEDFEIGNADIDAIDAFFGKAHARIDDNHLVAKTQQRAVHPKLADTAEGNYFEDVRHMNEKRRSGSIRQYSMRTSSRGRPAQG